MNTPKTDAACGWPWGHHGRIECSDIRWSPDGPFVHSEVARDLERENAALRQALEDMPTCRCGLSTDEQCALSVQNAALRKALEEAFSESDDTVRFHIIRNAVEALKEAQP